MTKNTPEVISAADAKAAGLRHYFTGKPCGSGALAPRRVSDRHCTCAACWAAKAEREGAKRKAKRKAKASDYNRRSAEWYRNNKDRKRETRRAWSEANREKRRASDQSRRSRFIVATPGWFGELDEFVIQEAAALACERERATGMPWHLDHMVPLQAKRACGLHCAANLQVIPAWMNYSKNNRLILCEPDDWIKAL